MTPRNRPSDVRDSDGRPIQTGPSIQSNHTSSAEIDGCGFSGRTSISRSDLSTLYRSHHKSISKKAIPWLLIALLYPFYISVEPSIPLLTVFDSGQPPWLSVPNPSLSLSIVILFPLLGVLSREEVKPRIDIVIKYLRVSSQAQESDGNSLDTQDDFLEDELAKLCPEEVVTIGDTWESAASMLRESIKQVLNEVEGEDQTYCLMIRDLDRLSRADPFEACTFLWLLKTYDVILYVHGEGYYDFSDHFDALRLFMQLVRAREGYEQIITNGADGRRKAIKRGEWPAPAPYGFDKQDDKLVLNGTETAVLQRALELLRDQEDSVKSAWERLGEEFDEDDLPAYQSFLVILRNPIIKGEMQFDGKVLNECPAILSEEEFDELQAQLGDRSNDEIDHNIDPWINRIVERYGVEPSVDLFSDILAPICPECGDTVHVRNRTTRRGEEVYRYRCSNHPGYQDDDDDDEDEDTDENESATETCDFEAPLLSEDGFLGEWDFTAPITCPVCQMPAEDDRWEQSPTKVNGIVQDCQYCGVLIDIALPEDKMERALEIPDAALRVFGDNWPLDSEDNDSDQGSDDKQKTEDHGDSEHSTLNDFFGDNQQTDTDQSSVA